MRLLEDVLLDWFIVWGSFLLAVFIMKLLL